ncbi:hypothetical protein DBB33_01390 [Chromobacterium haemolyticum]|nr:hypothetical protein DBB33_01390 [Chromobacterium haemolyticum]
MEVSRKQLAVLCPRYQTLPRSLLLLLLLGKLVKRFGRLLMVKLLYMMLWQQRQMPWQGRLLLHFLEAQLLA